MAETTTPSQIETAIPGLSTINPADLPKAGQMTRQVRAAAEPKNGWWWGTGRRKRAVARVRLRPVRGDGPSVRVQITSKKYKSIEEYFTTARDRNDVYAPLQATNLKDKVEVVVRCSGGGFMGQAQAVRLGIARAIRGYDPTLEEALRENGYLTRDAREVERKKYGQAGARRRFQFSKR